MAVCKKCGADDLYPSDLAGKYGCVYCFSYEETEEEKKEDDASSKLQNAG